MELHSHAPIHHFSLIHVPGDEPRWYDTVEDPIPLQIPSLLEV